MGTKYKRSAFTLVELLVVIGVISILIALLLPTLSAVRRAAKDTRCASQLRQLTEATVMYLNDQRHYPYQSSMPALGGALPLAIQAPVLNAIGPYLSWQPVLATQNIRELPALSVCNLRAEVDAMLEPYPPAAFGAPFWNTGYSYCGALLSMGQVSGTGKALIPQRVADLRGNRRGVLWSDNMVLMESGGAPIGWGYFHIKGGHHVEPVFLTIVDPVSYRGHHRAWSDGSVEWLPRGSFSLTPADAETTAAYRVGTAGLMVYIYY